MHSFEKPSSKCMGLSRIITTMKSKSLNEKKKGSLFGVILEESLLFIM